MSLSVSNMRYSLVEVAVTALTFGLASAIPQGYSGHTGLEPANAREDYYISLGPRPYFIIQNMTQGPLRSKLESCANGPFQITGYSIGHRGGGTLQIPEESVESALAGARMGAGILECDVTFTSDRGLVCRHSQCDLHTTTNILLYPNLAAKCRVPFTPANATSPANAVCCTSDITTAEYKTLCSKMDGFNASAKTVQDYQAGTPRWRTELYNTCAKPQTLESYIDLVDSLPGYRNFTPELKTPPAAYVPMPFKGYTQEQYASDMIETFIRKGINPNRVWAQSFNPPDIYQWLSQYHAFGKHAVYLDEDGDTPENYTTAVARLPSLKAKGVNVISPPINYLLTLTPDNKTIIPSAYANASKAAGLDIIAWTFERSPPPAQALSSGDYYYGSIAPALYSDGQIYEILNVLTNVIGIKALFSDWSATVTYFANCFGVSGPAGENYR